MRLNIILLAAFTLPIWLTACGGSNSNPYDGTWQAVYPPLSSASSVTETKAVVCDNPPTPLVIKDNVGSTQITATCHTTIYTTDATTGAVTTTTLPDTVTYANVSVSITTNPVLGQPDIMNAIANGEALTGQCISTSACSATSTATKDTLSLTR